MPVPVRRARAQPVPQEQQAWPPVWKARVPELLQPVWQGHSAQRQAPEQLQVQVQVQQVHLEPG